MEYKEALTRLERLKTLVDRYVPLMHQGSSDSKELHEELVRVYGEVAEVYLVRVRT